MELRKPRPEERHSINAMIMRSKAHWGYDAAFMESCRDELTLSSQQLSAENVRVLADEATIAGMVMLTLDGEVADLSKLFVDPDAIGTGAGQNLYNWALDQAKLCGSSKLMIDSDPQACGFYQRMGAKIVGETPSGSIEGRFLPLLQHDIAQN